MLSCLLSLLPLTRSAFVCSDVTSISLSVSWSPGADEPADVHLLLLSNASLPAPALMGITTSLPSATVIDLLPSTTYHFRARWHPASEPTVAWGPGWRDVAGEGSCTTKNSPRGAPHTLRRVGAAVEANSIALRWTNAAAGGASGAGLRVVGVAEAEGEGSSNAKKLHRVVVRAAPGATHAALVELHAGDLFMIVYCMTEYFTNLIMISYMIHF